MGDNRTGHKGHSEDCKSVHTVALKFEATVWFYLLRDMNYDYPDCLKMFEGYVLGHCGGQEIKYHHKKDKWLN